MATPLASPFPAILRRFIPLVCLLLLAAACGDGAGNPTETVDPTETPTATDAAGCVEDYAEGTDYFPDKVEFAHTTNVEVTYHDHYKVATVVPLRAPDATPVRYVLVQCGTPAPDDPELAGAQVIEVPVREVVTLTTSNIPHFAELGMAERVIGVGNPDFVATEAVAARIEGGDVEGYADADGAADLERIIAVSPDLLVIDGFGDTILEEVERYVAAGVPTALNADFVEGDLLGRAEWLKFTALFLNGERAATEAFERIETAYSEVADAAAGVTERPKVLANTPFEGTWYIPGGDSYFAHAVDTAGGDYAFADDDSQATLSLDIEAVLAQAADSDVWLQAGSVHGSLEDLLGIDARLGEFAAYSSGEVYAYDAWLTPGGGYAVFEVAYAHPDLFLADLVKILHPGLLPDHELRFFGKVGSQATADEESAAG